MSDYTSEEIQEVYRKQREFQQKKKKQSPLSCDVCFQHVIDTTNKDIQEAIKKAYNQ